MTTAPTKPKPITKPIPTDKGPRCPICGGYVISEENCHRCLDCSWTACEDEWDI